MDASPCGGREKSSKDARTGATGVYLAAMTTPPYPGQDPQYPNNPSQPPQYQPPQYQPQQYQPPSQQPQYQPQSNPYPGGGYPGGGYPGSGYPGQAQPGAAAEPDAPGSVKGAFLIYLVAALLAAIGIVLSLTSNVWEQAVQAAGANTSGISTQSLVNTVKITTVVIGVILLGLYLLFAFKMRAGRNWARIVLTVLSALSILSPASSSSSVTVNGTVYQSTSTQATGWIGAALAVIAIVLMYLPASNAYFTASKAARQRQLG
jgi:hypothetical protein